jgi:hypothetical protein
MMADLQRTRRAQAQKLRRDLPRIARPAHAALPLDRAHADRVEHGGDAAGRKLRVMGDDGGHVRPVGRRARADVPFQVVGVQLHQPGVTMSPSQSTAPAGTSPPRAISTISPPRKLIRPRISPPGRISRALARVRVWGITV